jgi:hypothetical protein
MLLSCGTVAGPLFLTIAFIQAYTRTGFDLRRHPFSMLSLGDLGWIQISNFILTGCLYVACAIGMRQALLNRPGGTWGPRSVAIFGLSQIGGGVFVADPALGFPAGTGDGVPATISWHSAVHGLAFGVGMVALITSFVVFARAFAATNNPGWARYTWAMAGAFLLLGAIGAGLGDWRLVALAIAFGWSWSSAVALRLQRSALEAARSR